MFGLNILVALAMGFAIGLERQWRQHSAGLRTNTLVALGAALFVSMSALMDDTGSPTRIVAYVVSGLGFIGGGVIMREGMNVRGLNTAATIWCTGAVGSMAGAGFLFNAMLGTAAILFVNIGLKPVADWIESHRRTAADVETYYRLRVTSHADHEAIIRNILLRHVSDKPQMSLQGVATDESNHSQPVVVANIFSTVRNDRFMEDLVKRISIEPEVTGVSWEKVPG
jgi:putative Mg2+ transporter-C (MgtC) family protein